MAASEAAGSALLSLLFSRLASRPSDDDERGAGGGGGDDDDDDDDQARPPAIQQQVDDAAIAARPFCRELKARRSIFCEGAGECLGLFSVSLSDVWVVSEDWYTTG